MFADIIGDFLVVSYALLQHLAGHVYSKFSVNAVPKILEYVSHLIRASIQRMHVGATAHFDSSLYHPNG